MRDDFTGALIPEFGWSIKYHMVVTRFTCTASYYGHLTTHDSAVLQRRLGVALRQTTVCISGSGVLTTGVVFCMRGPSSRDSNNIGYGYFISP